MPPNILWICTDQQRFDTLGCYGNEHVASEHLDQLAEDGVRFERAYCQSPVCTPSRASFLTGRYPRTTRTRQNGQAIPDSERLITRELADAGYTCGLSGKLHLSPANPSATELPNGERRIDDGYAEFRWSHDTGSGWPTNQYHQWLREQGVTYRSEPLEESPYSRTSVPAEYHQTTWCADRAITFIEEQERFDDPWLYSVNPFDPHVPFDPPREYLEPYLDRLEEIPLPNYEPGERADKSLFQRHPTSTGRFPYDEMDETDHRIARAAYWAMCDLIDDQVGRMLEALDRTDQRDDTIVIFMSDHGELLGDHGLYLKGPHFYEPAIRVPLIMAGPGIDSGHSTDALVELVDLAPTLAEAAGIESSPGIQGRSLWPLLQQDRDDHRSDIYCEFYHALGRTEYYEDLPIEGETPFQHPYADTDVREPYQDEARQRTLPYATMVRTDRYKLVRVHSRDECELYDLEVDPEETTNLATDPDYESVKQDLLVRLTDRMAGTIDPLPERTAPW